MPYKIGDTVFDGWEIIREIGSGAYSRVYEIQKSEYEIRVSSALKVMRIPASDNEIELALSEGLDMTSVYRYFRGFVDELAEEIVVMTKLQGHPCIVSYQDHHVEEQQDKIGWEILIRMELLEPLVRYLLRNPEMEESQIVSLGMDISSALSLCHKIGIIHRDIKPENVFWNQAGGFFKLGDFGIARTLEKTENSLSRKGTMSYMAPEIYNGKAYGKTADIYSLGVLLYRCANRNRLPFYPAGGNTISYEQRESAMSRRMTGETLPLPCGVSPELGRIILKACEYDPGDRWQDAEELYAALSELSLHNQNNEETEKDSADSFEKGNEVYGTGSRGKIRKENDGSRHKRENEETVSYDQGWIAAVQSGKKEEKESGRKKKRTRKSGSGKSKKGILKWIPYLAAAGVIAILFLFLHPFEKKEEVTYLFHVAGGRIQDDEKNGNYSAGSRITLQADTKKGYRFSGWEIEGGSAEIEEASSEKTTVVTGDADTSVRAVFTVDGGYMKSREAGDMILFGLYEQDNDTENGKEDIEWIVLENDGKTLLVISKYALDTQPYNGLYIDVSWSKCELRRRMNSIFVNEAFTDEEQRYISETTVSNADNPVYGTEGGEDTRDKLFLLSIKEARKYFAGDNARVCEPTAYAAAQGAYLDAVFGKYCWWWLRSPGESANHAATIPSNGAVYSRGDSVHYTNYCVRPAMRLKYEKNSSIEVTGISRAPI